jgi:DNA-binding transcriptional LysR family regulator
MTQDRPVDVLQHLTTFVRIADAGSISAAARTLRLSVAMASRHLRALEEEFGTPLMRRTTRRIDLTDAGTELLARARGLLIGLEEARAAVRPGRGAAGLVVLSAPVSFGLAKLAPLVPALLAAHPRLTLDVRFDDRVVDLLGDGVDLAIRVGVAAPDSPFLVARRLATYERVLCASPAFLDQAGPLHDVAALATAPCVVHGTAPTSWQFETLTGPVSVTVTGRVRTNNILAVRDAALAGLGVAQVPRWLVVEDLRKKRLVRILEGAVLPTVHVIGLVHAAARGTARLRHVLDFLADALPAAMSAASPPR